MCTKFNCKDCLKNSKINSAENSVLQEMRENLKKIPMPDGTIQYSIKYVTNAPLSESFPSKSSNYLYTCNQAKFNYKKILAQTGGKAAVDELVARGVREGHFRLLDKGEAEQVLNKPHYLCSQSVCYKENSNHTKIRHISNPSAIGKHSGQSLNLVQKVPGNLMNNALWPLQLFILYPYPYSSDISSATAVSKLILPR